MMRCGLGLREIAVCCAAIFFAAEAGAAEDARSPIPDFTGLWQHGGDQIIFHPVPDKPSPVIDVGSADCMPDCPPRPGGLPYIGDWTNPVLGPEAAAAVKAMGDRWRAGEVVNAATELCLPSGVPHILTVFAPVQLLQEPDMITILYERDQQIRRVFLNRKHSENLEPSWYGESVGHYEGDTLVVDTIGLNDRSIIDRFGAPQTETIHVVERYRVSDDGNSLVALVNVEDRNAFTTPWWGTITYTRSRNLPVMGEVFCAENNKNASTGEDYPIPIDTSPDF